MIRLWNVLDVAAAAIGVGVKKYSQPSDKPVQLSLGYIGNLYRDLDDRSWYVWFHGLPSRLCFNYPIYNNTPSLHLGRTEDVEALTPEELVERIAERYYALCERMTYDEKEALCLSVAS